MLWLQCFVRLDIRKPTNFQVNQCNAMNVDLWCVREMDAYSPLNQKPLRIHNHAAMGRIHRERCNEIAFGVTVCVNPFVALTLLKALNLPRNNYLFFISVE